MTPEAFVFLGSAPRLGPSQWQSGVSRPPPPTHRWPTVHPHAARAPPLWAFSMQASETVSSLPQNKFAVEIGMGVDLHGQDATVAAVRACQDAMQRNSYPGLRSWLPHRDLQQMVVHVLLGVPSEWHTKVDADQVRQVFPYGQVRVEVVPGGLCARSGICLQDQGDAPEDDRMVLVNAVITLGY